jgi:hypothetical protein
MEGRRSGALQRLRDGCAAAESGWRLAEGEDAEVRDFAEVGFVLGPDENAEAEAAGGGGHGEIVLRNLLAGGRELGKYIGVVFRGEGTKRFDPSDFTNRFQAGPAFAGAGSILGQADTHQGFGPNHSGEDDFLVRGDGFKEGGVF